MYVIAAQFRNNHAVYVSEETASFEVCAMFTEHPATSGQISFTMDLSGNATLAGMFPGKVHKLTEHC